MEEMKIDRRAVRTRKGLRKSLLSLMKDRPIAKITVKELCAKAEINRTTFYAHYTDISELLEQIETDLLGEIATNLTSGLSNDAISDMLMNLLLMIQKNADICTVMLGKNGDQEFFSRIMAYAEQASTANWKKQNPQLTDEMLHAIFVFISSGSIALIKQWINEGMKTNISEIALFISKLTQLEIRNLQFN